METHLPNLGPEDAEGWREGREAGMGELNYPLLCTCNLGSPFPKNPTPCLLAVWSFVELCHLDVNWEHRFIIKTN